MNFYIWNKNYSSISAGIYRPTAPIISTVKYVFPNLYLSPMKTGSIFHNYCEQEQIFPARKSETTFTLLGLHRNDSIISYYRHLMVKLMMIKTRRNSQRAFPGSLLNSEQIQITVFSYSLTAGCGNILCHF